MEASREDTVEKDREIVSLKKTINSLVRYFLSPVAVGPVLVLCCHLSRMQVTIHVSCLGSTVHPERLTLGPVVRSL